MWRKRRIVPDSLTSEEETLLRGWRHFRQVEKKEKQEEGEEEEEEEAKMSTSLGG